MGCIHVLLSVKTNWKNLCSGKTDVPIVVSARSTLERY